MHRHEASYRFPISMVNGVERGMCNCRQRVVRQLRDGEAPATTRALFIPIDMDEAHAEASIEDAARGASVSRRESF